jgi:soluble lytic murein transglycosylase-like protein
MRGALAAAVVMGLAAGPAKAGIFDGLFASPEAASQSETAREQQLLGPSPEAGACIAAVRRAEAVHGIPADLLLAIGLQEAGIGYQGSMTIWPWSLNVDGKGYRFDTRAEAESFLARELEQGRQSIDVGCLQINLRWHPGAFPSPAAGFDPERNADYAARFLRALYHDTGDWLEAAGRYHSATTELKETYLAGVERHLSRLDGNSGAIDALAGTVGLPGGTALAPGVSLDARVVRRLHPLRAPVRSDGPTAVDEGSYRRTLLALPRPTPGGRADDEDLP